MRVRLNKGFNGVGLILQERDKKIIVAGFTPNGPASKNQAIRVEIK